MLAEALRERGYATAHIGKWHLGAQRPEYLPDAKGFETTWTTGTWRGYARTQTFADGVAISPQPAEHLTQRITDQAIAYLRAHRDERFFLNLWYFAPHVPLQPPPDWAQKHPKTTAGRYAALLGYVDQQIGRVLSAIEELELGPHTAVLISSDNGGAQASHRARSESLRGYKKDLYEGGIRSPLLIRWPGRTGQAARNPSVTATHDLFPTILDLLGETPATGPPPPFAGQSFAGALGGGTFRRQEPLIWQFNPTDGSLPAAEGAAGYLEHFAVRDGRWKLVLDGQDLSLFDLEQDPKERRDLREEETEITARLQREYDAWRIAKSRRPTRIDGSTANAIAGEGSLRFDAPGAARLEVAPPFDQETQNFSCRFGLTLERTGAAQRVLGRRPTWGLSLDVEQHLVLTLTTGADPTRSWASARPLTPRRRHDIALTFATLSPGQVARVFLDGEPAIVARTQAPLAMTDAPIEVSGSAPGHLSATLDSLACFTASLTANDL